MKPCISCGEPCEVFAIQLGDSFTLTWLRVCNERCLFETALEYLYSIGESKNYRNSLYKLMNKEDSEALYKFMDQATEAALKDFRKHLEENPDLLTTPYPKGIIEAFKDHKQIPVNSGTTCRFVRPKVEDLIKYQKQYIDDLKRRLRDAEEYLTEKMKLLPVPDSPS